MSKKPPKKSDTKKKKADLDDVEREPTAADLAVDVVEPEDVDLDDVDLEVAPADEKNDL